MTKFIKGKDGKFAGSIGDGKTAVPTSGLIAPIPAPATIPAPGPDLSLEDLWAGYQMAAPTRINKRSETYAPAAVRDELAEIDTLGERAATALLSLEDSHLTAITSFREHERAEAEDLRAKQEEIHRAVIRARNEIRQARAFIEGDFMSMPDNAAAVIDADALSWEAMETADLLDERAEEQFHADPEVRARYRKASAHVREAHRMLDDTLRDLLGQ